MSKSGAIASFVGGILTLFATVAIQFVPDDETIEVHEKLESTEFRLKKVEYDQDEKPTYFYEKK